MTKSASIIIIELYSHRGIGLDLLLNKDNKQVAFALFKGAGITLAIVFISRLFTLFNPLLKKVYFGTLTEIIYYLFLFAVSLTTVVLMWNYFKKRYGLSIFESDCQIPDKKGYDFIVPSVVIGVVAITVALTGVYFNGLKVEQEMGTGITGYQAMINVSVYFYYGFHLWLAITAMTMVQKGCDRLFVTKYGFHVGVIMLVTVFGLLELVLELSTTNHLFPLLYYIYLYVYGIIFIVTKSYNVTLWSAIVIMVL